MADASATTINVTPAPVKPGWQTTEFWLNLLNSAGTVAAVAAGASNPITVALGALGTVASIVYTLCRSKVKINAVQAASDAAVAAATAVKNDSTPIKP